MYSDDCDDIVPGHQGQKLVPNKRAIVHAHATRRTGVHLRSWWEARVKRYEVEDDENEAILEDMGQLY